MKTLYNRLGHVIVSKTTMVRMNFGFRYVVFFLIILFAQKCNSQQQRSATKAEKRSYVFDFSSHDPAKIGMRKFDDGSEQSITSICRFENFIFMTDPVHRNIKRLSISDGTMLVSRPIVDIRDLSDLEVIDSLLYVVSSGGFLIILDLELELKETVRLPIDVCDDIRFLNCELDHYVFCPGEMKQDKSTYEITIPVMEVSSSLSFTQTSKSAGKGYNAYLELVQGYALLPSGNCLKVDSVERCIDRPYPTGHRFPTTRTVALTPKSLAMFDVNGDKFIVYSYDWPEGQNEN